MIRFTCKTGTIVQLNNVVPNKLYCVGLYWNGKRIYVQYFSNWDAAWDYFEVMSGH